MVRYRLSDDGNSRECSAEPGNCPNEGKFPHFPSKEIARAAYESRNYTFGNTIKKLPKVPPGTANPILNEAKIIYKMNQWGEAPHTEKDGGKFIFLNIRGVNVSAVKIYENDDGPKLCDIETNPEYRQQGYAKELLRQVAELYGVEDVRHTGGFTPDGYNFISHLVERPKEAGAAAIAFTEFDDNEPFSFIQSWENQKTRWDG